MNLTRRCFPLVLLAVVTGIVPRTSVAVPIEAMSRLMAGAEQPIEISGNLSPALREALAAVIAGQYDKAIAQTTKIIVDRPQSEAAAAYEIRGTALVLKGDAEAAVTALKRSVELDPQRSSAFTKLGSLDLDAGHLADARKNLERAVALNGGDTRARERLAGLLERQGDRAGAIQQYTALVADKPGSFGIKVVLARLYNQEQRFGDAIALLEPVMKGRANDTQAVLVLGAAYLGKGDGAQAVTLLRAARNRATDDTSLTLGAGIAERVAGQLDASLASLQRALGIKQNWATAYYQLGFTYLAQKKNSEARAAFEKAQSLAPDPAVIQQELGATLLFAGQTDGVIAAIRTLGSRDNPRLSDFLTLATVYLALNQTPQAEQTYRDAVKRFPKEAAAYLRLAALLVRQQKYEDALRVLTDCTAIAPSDPQLLRNLAVEQARLKRYPDAVSTAEHLVSLDRRDPDRQFLLGTLYEASGDRAHAMQTYQGILADHPDHMLTLNNLAALETTGGDAEAAVSLARRAVALAPQIAAVQDTLGWALLQDGRAAEAVKVLEKARELAPADPEALYRLAVAQKAAGDRAAAQQNVQKALWMSTNFKDVDAARKLLSETSQ